VDWKKNIDKIKKMCYTDSMARKILSNSSKKGDVKMDAPNVQMMATLLVAMFILFWLGFPRK